jgi:hypothetical protein
MNKILLMVRKSTTIEESAMSQSTIAAPPVVEHRADRRAPAAPAPTTACAPGLRARVFAQLTLLLSQLAQR